MMKTKLLKTLGTSLLSAGVLYADKTERWLETGDEMTAGDGSHYRYTLDEKAQAASMEKKVRNFHKGHDPRNVYVVYFSPSDRKHVDGYQERLTEILDHIQSFYEKEFDARGFKGLSFDFERDSKGEFVYHMIQGHRPASQHGRAKNGLIKEHIAKHFAKKGIQYQDETILVFQNLAQYTPGESFSDLDASYHGAWGRDSGMCWVVDYADLKLGNLQAKGPMLRVNDDRTVSLGQLTTTQIGGIAHEMGHMFTLHHTAESRGHHSPNLMSHGNYAYGSEHRDGEGTFISFPSSAYLLSHPAFAGSHKDRRSLPKVKLKDIQFFTETDEFRVQGAMESKLPVHAAYLRMDHNPANGGYGAVTSVSAPDKNGVFDLSLKLKPGRNYELQLFFQSVNHGRHEKSFWVKTDDKGRVILPMMTRLEVLRHFSGEDPDKGNKIAEFLKEVDSVGEPMPLSSVPATLKSVSLGEVQWENAFTGYGGPRHNKTKDDGRWSYLTTDERIYRRGLYAHADSNYQFRLDGKWHRFAGFFSLQRGYQGSVRFRVIGDGKVLFESKVIRDSADHPVKVDVRGVDVLELVNDHAGDDKRNDWGIWCAPTLMR